MKRKIIAIDREKCTGCGLCAAACHEGAIVMQDGKARLLRDDYCDGLGDCLPACPVDAISFVEREALPYDEAAVQRAMAEKKARCPGIASAPSQLPSAGTAGASCLAQWPVQLRLVPAQAPFFAGAHILLAADCSAFAHGDFHREFMRGKVTLIACPKLDAFDNAAKLYAIMHTNAVKALTVVRMSVPCCGGLATAARLAAERAGGTVALHVITLNTDGSVMPHA